MLALLRRNTIALIALFIALGGTAYAANTVRSADIVDGTIKTVDLANGAVTQAKASGLLTRSATLYSYTYQCAKPETWISCAQTTVTVPAGHIYVITVRSIVSVLPTGSTPVQALFCAAKEGPTCINTPVQATFWPGGVTYATDEATASFSPGAHTLNTATKFGATLNSTSQTHTTTTIVIQDIFTG